MKIKQFPKHKLWLYLIRLRAFLFDLEEVHDIEKQCLTNEWLEKNRTKITNTFNIFTEIQNKINNLAKEIIQLKTENKTTDAITKYLELKQQAESFLMQLDKESNR